MKQHLFSRFFNFVLSPIRHNFTHFVMIFVLASGFQIFSQFLMNDPLRNFNIVTMFMWGLVIAYLGSGIIMITPLKLCLRNITIGIIYSLLVLSSLADIIIFGALRIVWNENFPAILAATNSQESAEFIDFYFSGNTIFWILGWIFFCVVIGLFLKYLRKHAVAFSKKTKDFIAYVLLGLTVVSVVYVCRTPDTKAFTISLPGKIYSMRFFKQVEDIEMPQLKIFRVSDPDISTVYLVIGESHSRSHSQLYGYEKQNMPRLSALLPDRLVVFDDIEASETHTQAAFKGFMTTSGYSSEPWNKSNNIIQLMKEAGYKTIWISNQNCRGVHENVISRFVSLCDTSLWTSDQYSIKDFTLISRYDGSLPLIYDKFDEKDGFVVFHLMGSHAKFSCRYPSSFKGFKPDEYKGFPENQRSSLAEYDTAILYTDYVLNEIFKRAEKTGALVIYFSDHGLDLFVTDPNRCGHADNNNPESVRVGKQIPFMVYVPEVFEKEHPELVSRIRKAAKQKGNTNQLFFTLMDVLGVSSPQWPDAAKHSLFYVD